MLLWNSIITIIYSGFPQYSLQLTDNIQSSRFQLSTFNNSSTCIVGRSVYLIYNTLLLCILGNNKFVILL